MSTRFVLLLCALLLLAGCVTPAHAAIAPTPIPALWQDAEIRYLDALLPAIAAVPEALFLLARNFKDNDAQASLQASVDVFIAHPMPPATLAVIDLYVGYAASACSSLLHVASATGAASYIQLCSDNIRTIRLELARLYAARGTYPPGYLP